MERTFIETNSPWHDFFELVWLSTVGLAMFCIGVVCALLLMVISLMARAMAQAIMVTANSRHRQLWREWDRNISRRRWRRPDLFRWLMHARRSGIRSWRIRAVAFLTL